MDGDWHKRVSLIPVDTQVTTSREIRPCDAVVLAGGFGTRLKPLTASLPKPMVPVGNRPLMEHVIGLLADHGFKDILVLLFFEAERITDHFDDGSRFGVRMQYLRPNGDFGTAGSVRHALDMLADRFLVIAGDVLTDINLSAARDYHANQKADATIVLTRHTNPLPYGIVLTDSESRITRFLEKPTWGEVFSDTVNTGIYFLEKSLLAPWSTERSVDFSQDVFPQALAQGKKLVGPVAEGYWRDVGHVDDYAQSHLDLLSNRVKVHWPNPPVTHDDAQLVCGADCIIDPKAHLSGTVILGDRVSIGPNAQIADSFIGSGSAIGNGARVRRSVIWSAVGVGVRSDLNETIVQSGTRIGSDCILRERTIVSELCRLGERVTVQPGCKIWPHKSVEDGAHVSSSIVWGEHYNRELFTDAKVSGLTNREITPEFAARLGAAFASQFPHGTVLVVARDSSLEARAVTEALKSGITSSGVNVRDLRDTVVPILRFELSQNKQEPLVNGGLYVRRSPDNRQITDAIFFDKNGFDLSGGSARSVERVFFREDFRRAEPDEIGSIRYSERFVHRYREAFLTKLRVGEIRARQFRIVVDYANGLMSHILPPLLEELGVESVALNSTTLDSGINSHDVAFRSLSRIVPAMDCDLGVHLHPAGEKMTVVTRDGRIIGAQQLLLAVAELAWRVHPNAAIAVPVTATSRVEDMANLHGGSVDRVKSDHLSMMLAAATGKVVLVAGTRGGFIFPGWQRGADAAAALANVLELLARSDAEIGLLTDTIKPGEFMEAAVPCQWRHKGALMRRILEETADLPRQMVDGVRISLEKAWLWIAPDRRNALFRIQVEADTQAHASDLLAEWGAHVAAWRGELERESTTEEKVHVH